VANFSYRALSSQGKPVSGAIAAERVELAARELRAQGLTLLSLETATTGAGVATGAGAGDTDAIQGLTRELAVLLRAGLPIDRALKVMIDMADRPAMRQLLQDLLDSVKAGKGLSQALLAYPREFSHFYVSMVRAGEASGHLAEVLARLADYLADARAVRSGVVSALIYPAILLAVAMISIAAMLGFVVPQFETLFLDMGDALPLLTRGVIAAGDFLARYGVVLLVVVALAVLLLRNRWRSPEGRAQFDRRLLQTPLLGPIVYKYEVAMFARTLGTLLGNGVSLLQSIGIAVETVGNRQIKAALATLEPAVKRGQRVSDALESAAVFSPLMIQMARVGEESGSLDQMMTELSAVYDGEVQTGIKRGLTLLEPLLILTMAAVIAVIIIAILMGIMSVNNLAL